jgi:hypothetical protein
MLAAQRLLVRRASISVPPRQLWQPPPMSFAPDDIPDPERPGLIETWFLVTRACPLLFDAEYDRRRTVPAGAGDAGAVDDAAPAAPGRWCRPRQDDRSDS